jgi:hypothetical protein
MSKACLVAQSSMKVSTPAATRTTKTPDATASVVSKSRRTASISRASDIRTNPERKKPRR